MVSNDKQCWCNAFGQWFMYEKNKSKQYYEKTLKILYYYNQYSLLQQSTTVITIHHTI